MVDFRTAFLGFWTFLFLGTGGILLAVNFTEQRFKAAGVLSVGGVLLIAFLAQCTGCNHNDEKELFGENAGIEDGK